MDGKKDLERLVIEPMKIEPRGKYAGVKVHLDGDEAGAFLKWADGKWSTEPNPSLVKFASKLGGKIQRLIEEIPNLLEDRTEEQIKDALEGDQEKIEKQLAALSGGKDWKRVK